MANIKSAKKRILVNQAKTEENKRLKTNLKTVLKKAEAAIETNAADKDAAVKLAVKKIDQACAKGILKKNTASRKKSKLALHVNKAGYVSIRLFVLKRFPYRDNPIRIFRRLYLLSGTGGEIL